MKKSNNAVVIRNAYVYDFGGGERFPVFLAENIQDSFTPIIISRSDKLLKFAQSRDIKTIRGWWWSRQNWSGWRMGLYPIYLLWQVFLTCWYLSVFYRLKPQVVHIQSKDDFIAASIAAKILGSRVIWTDHADLKHVWLNAEKPFRNLVGKTVLWASRYADAITLVSKSEQDFISAHLSNHPSTVQKMTVVHNGVLDSLALHPPKKHKEEFVFCVASRLVVDKGIGEVIEAFSRVYKKHPYSRLVIMGDGPEAKRFQEQARQVSAISLLGHVDQPLEVMATSNAFVHPTYHEGFSVALVEASMMKLPIIATSVGGNLEIIRDNETGLLVPIKDVDALANAMEQLIKDPILCEKLAANAREQFVTEFEFSAIVQKYFLPLYNKT